ncbi:hypothetical protein K502DRAFT_347326 [Neoconidiobolus thromboides FSU 785]|nr:hypothetical protein K502DRAFT_347326 [Neoconidiobolus thromboides FSU 785]
MNLWSTIELSTMRYDAQPPESTDPLQGFYLESEYTLKHNIDQACYKVMMYGDLSLKKELKKVIIRTFCFRMFLVLPLVLSVVFGASFIFTGGKYYFYYLLLIFSLFVLGFSIQLYFLIHYLRSVRSRESYIKLNKDMVTRFETLRRVRDQFVGERADPQPETERAMYTLPPPPPIYNEFDNLPPSYEPASLSPTYESVNNLDLH